MKLWIKFLLIGAAVILGGVVLPLAVGRDSADRVVLWFLVGLTLGFLVEYYWDQAGVNNEHDAQDRGPDSIR